MISTAAAAGAAVISTAVSAGAVDSAEAASMAAAATHATCVAARGLVGGAACSGTTAPLGCASAVAVHV
jgi:hypothetical protein